MANIGHLKSENCMLICFKCIEISFEIHMLYFMFFLYLDSPTSKERSDYTNRNAQEKYDNFIRLSGNPEISQECQERFEFGNRHDRPNKDRTEFSKRYDRTNQNRPPYNKQLYEKTGNPLQDRRQAHNSPRTKTHQTDKNKTNFTKTYSQDRKHVPITDPDGLGSDSWLNFKLDIDAVMSCLA